MTKILFLISKMDIGGAEKILHDLALALNQNSKDYKITVVCLYARGKLGWMLSENGVELYDSVLKNRFDIAGAIRFIGILRKKRPDILYIAGQTLSQAMAFIGSIFVKIPVKIIGVHSHDLAKRAFYKLLIDRISFLSAQRIVCVSESQKTHIVKHKNVNPEKIKVIYNGVDVNRFGRDGNKERGRFFLPKSAVVIGTVASLRREKGLDMLVRAIPEILRHCPKAYFLIIGNGREKHGLEIIAKDLGVYSKVRFLGEREDVDKIIPSFDIACSSSRIENFPLSILEYMACEKAVVATRVGGVPEMVEDGVNGILVNSESERDIAENIVRLVNDRLLCESMGKKGRMTVEKSFTLERMIDNYKSLFKEIQG